MDGLKSGGECYIVEFVPQFGTECEVFAPSGVVAYGGGIENSGFYAHRYGAECIAGFETYRAVVAYLLTHK